MTRCKSMNPKTRKRCYKAKAHTNKHEDLDGGTWTGEGAPVQEKHGPEKGKGGRPKKKSVETAVKWTMGAGKK